MRYAPGLVEARGGELRDSKPKTKLTEENMKIRTSQLFPSRKGFTLIEMLLVLTILSLLAGLVFPRMMHHGQDAKLKATKVQMKALEEALGLYEMDQGGFPKGTSGLSALVVKPAGASNWHKYLKQVPKDSWGNDYVYVFPGKHDPEGFDLASAGPDGQFGTEDDINNWSEDKPQATK